MNPYDCVPEEARATLKQIKLGSWVETTVGIGTVERIGGTHPPSVRVHVRTPIPRGLVNVKPRDVLRQLSHEESKSAERSIRRLTMAKITLDYSDGRYSTRLLTDEEAAKYETDGYDVVHLEDHIYEAYVRDCERDSIWQALWRTISNDQSMRRREKELRPLEDAEREIRRLGDALAQAQRMWKHFEDEATRVRQAVRGHARENREWTCVFPVPGCNVDLLPPAWRDRAKEILAKYSPALAAEGMQVQGCCCGHDHQRVHEATVVQLRRVGFIVEHDSDKDLHVNQYDNEFTCIYPRPGCQIDALPQEWQDRAKEILAQYRSDRVEGSEKYQGCCCLYGNHRLLDDAEAKRLRDAGFIVENDTEDVL